MYERHWSDAEIQAARLDAARKVRDHCLKLTGPDNPITSGLPDGLPNGDEISMAIEQLDDAALTKILEGGAYPPDEQRPDHPVNVRQDDTASRPTADTVPRATLVGEGVSGGTAGVAPRESAALESPPRSSGELAEPPRPYPETWATIDDAYRMGAQAERARAAGIIRGLIENCSDWELEPDGRISGAINDRERKLFAAARAYLADSEQAAQPHPTQQKTCTWEWHRTELRRSVDYASQQARRDAFEEAAKIADEHMESCPQGSDVAAAIRERAGREQS